jgi:hypothetical protein
MTEQCLTTINYWSSASPRALPSGSSYPFLLHVCGEFPDFGVALFGGAARTSHYPHQLSEYPDAISGPYNKFDTSPQIGDEWFRYYSGSTSGVTGISR